MSDESTTPTQPVIEAAKPVDPPSWHGPVAKLDSRITSLETGFARLEQKTDTQTIMLVEIKAALAQAAKNPYVRAISIGVALLILAWLAKHGIKVEIPQ